jgi:hypothetical protein
MTCESQPEIAFTSAAVWELLLIRRSACRSELASNGRTHRLRRARANSAPWLFITTGAPQARRAAAAIGPWGKGQWAWITLNCSRNARVAAAATPEITYGRPSA